MSLVSWQTAGEYLEDHSILYHSQLARRNSETSKVNVPQLIDHEDPDNGEVIDSSWRSDTPH